MQGLVFLFWLLCALALPGRWARRALALGLLWAFAGQYLCLFRAGQLNVITALPLHLCGAMALMTLLALLRPSPLLYAPLWLLGVPCALMALVFPAMVSTDHPLIMALSFYSVHALIIAGALYQRRVGCRTLPTDGRWTLLGLCCFAALVYAVDLLINANYLFLRRAPEKTPLAFAQARGQGAYLLYLLMGALMLIALLSALYGKINAIAGNSSSRSLPCRYS